MNETISLGIGKNRIEALTDGIFAIALTLLVLDIKVPALAADEDGSALVRKLLALWPNFLAFGVSFLIIGVNWVGHHALMHFVHRSDRMFLWINLFYLLVISAMPFLTALLAAYHRFPVAVAIYSGSLIVAGLLLFAQLCYAAGPGQLMEAEKGPDFFRAASGRILMGPVLYAIALVLVFVHTGISLGVCALVPVLYILPGRVDRFWKNRSRGAGGIDGL
jgi:uncharacterized membrane protein